jgi:S1-C subfamily serine protease
MPGAISTTRAVVVRFALHPGMRQPASARHAVASSPVPGRWRAGSLVAVAASILASGMALGLVLTGVATCDAGRADELVTFTHLGLTLARPASLAEPQPIPGDLTGGLFARAGAAAADAAGDQTRTVPTASTEPLPPASLQGRRREGAARAASNEPPAPAATPAHTRAAEPVPYHVAMRAAAPRGLGVELHIERAPQHPRTALALARSVRHGPSLDIAEVATERIHGRTWQRTRFVYVTEDGPAAGVEYAALAGPYLYRVTTLGPRAAAAALAARVAPTLRLQGAPGPTLAAPQPLVAPAAVQRAAGAVVAVLAADLAHAAPGQPGAVTPAAMGSGVVVDVEGRVLTSLHTLEDERRSTLHDLFLIAREHPAGALTFVCAGRPGHGHLDRALDLALVRCELDMRGQPLAPSGWPELVPAPTEPPAVGARLWVLGYAEADDGALRARSGSALGPSQAGADPAQRLAVDVPIAPGMSGGAVLDERGALIGVVQGFRERFEASRARIRGIGRIGLVLPAHQARPLLDAR